jgi:hypothetical protein
MHRHGKADRRLCFAALILAAVLTLGGTTSTVRWWAAFMITNQLTNNNYVKNTIK